ncbi:MAG: hypothetical protein ACPHQ8_02050, partial [Candidatus Puniceispirillaceae bacterium]
MGRLPGGMVKLREIAGANTRHIEIRWTHISSYIGKPATGKAPYAMFGIRPTLFLCPSLRLNTGRPTVE